MSDDEARGARIAADMASAEIYELREKLTQLEARHAKVVRALEYIFVCNPYPDLSYHKWVDAFKLIEDTAEKALGYRPSGYQPSKKD